jgi:hypothetical protein
MNTLQCRGGRREGNCAVVGKNKLSSYKTNREEIDRASGRACIIFKLFGFASLRKRSPFVSVPQHLLTVSRFACLVCHLSYWDGNSLRTNASLSFSVPFFLSLFSLYTGNSSASLALESCAHGGLDCFVWLQASSQITIQYQQSICTLLFLTTVRS